jgi:hypothetical protein
MLVTALIAASFKAVLGLAMATAKGGSKSNSNKGSATPTKGSAPTTPTKKAPRESNFSKGKFKGIVRSPGKQFDPRNRMVVEGLQNNITIMMIYKAGQDHEAFLNYDYQMARESEEYRDRSGISLFGTYLKGDDGRTPLPQSDTSTWGFRIAIVCAPNDTEEKRKVLAHPWIEELNKNATSEFYRYPKKTRFASDKTPENMRKASEALLDEAVVALMLADSGNAPISELMEDTEYMARFWDDVADGRLIMEEYAEGEEAAEEHQSENNANHGGAYAPGFNPPS